MESNPASPAEGQGAALPKGSLTCELRLSVHARNTTSSVDVLLFALNAYQDNRLKEAFQSFKDEEYDHAYEQLCDAQAAQALIVETALEISALADKNYWASVGEHPKEGESSAGFDRFMRDYVGKDPNSFDESAGIRHFVSQEARDKELQRLSEQLEKKASRLERLSADVKQEQAALSAAIANALIKPTDN